MVAAASWSLDRSSLTSVGGLSSSSGAAGAAANALVPLALLPSSPLPSALMISLRSKVSSKLDGRSREGGDEGDEEFIIRNVRPDLFVLREVVTSPPQGRTTIFIILRAGVIARRSGEGESVDYLLGAGSERRIVHV